MNPKDWFILIVRLVGIALFLYGLNFFLRFVNEGFLYEARLYNSMVYTPPFALFLYSFVYGSLACYFLFGTQHLANLCYGRDIPEETREDENYWGEESSSLEEEDYPEEEED